MQYFNFFHQEGYSGTQFTVLLGKNVKMKCFIITHIYLFYDILEFFII